MKYFSRDEVERIGQAGSYRLDTQDGAAYRYLSSFWLYVEPNDLAFTPHGPSGYWEAWVTKWMSQEFDNHDLFIDVGANVGYYSLMAAKHGITTFAVEPQERLCEMIKKSCSLNNIGIGVNNLALSDHSGYMTLVVPDGHSGGAWLMTDGLHNEAISPLIRQEVEVNTLDYSFSGSGRKILMKIDAEGAEPQIIAGGKNFFMRNNVTVALEWYAGRWDDADRFAKELYALSPDGLSVIDYDGNERPVTPDELVASRELEMVVVRATA